MAVAGVCLVAEAQYTAHLGVVMKGVRPLILRTHFHAVYGAPKASNWVLTVGRPGMAPPAALWAAPPGPGEDRGVASSGMVSHASRGKAGPRSNGAGKAQLDLPRVPAAGAICWDKDWGLPADLGLWP